MELNSILELRSKDSAGLGVAALANGICFSRLITFVILPAGALQVGRALGKMFPPTLSVWTSSGWTRWCQSVMELASNARLLPC
jgi:hypothetical protein